MGAERTFLVLEDDAGFLKTVCRLLVPFGHVEVAMRCSEARAIVPAVPRWHGWIFDIVLPDGDGLDLLSELRRAGHRVPTLVLTAHLTPELVRRAQELQASYLVKPLGRENAQAFVDWCASWSSRPTIEAIVDSLANPPLSKREREVLILKTKGLTRAEIAVALGIDQGTIPTYVKRMLPKIGFPKLDAAVAHIHRQILGSPPADNGNAP